MMETSVQEHHCILCRQPVNDDDEALDCEACSRWQHLRCGIDITRATYWKSIATNNEISWLCLDCQPDNEVTDDQIRSMVLDAEEQSLISRSDVETVEVTVPRSPQDIPFSNAHNLEDSSTPNAPVDHISSELPVANETTYKVMVGGSERGRDILVGSDGYSYTVRQVNPSGTRLWRCRLRGRNPCLASIRETPTGYAKGRQPHNHPGKPSALEPTAKSKKKKRPMTEIHFQASSIAEGVECKKRQVDASSTILSLAGNASYTGERLRSEEPTTLDFDLEEDRFPEEFLIKDIRESDARHVVLSNKSQLKILKKAECWYMNASSKVVRSPFLQIFTIQAFVRSQGKTEQLPLAFAIMSRRRKTDYKSVLRCILGELGHHRLRRVVLNFEKALWKAVKAVLPTIERKGCALDFTQAVFRQIKELGLQKLYTSKNLNYLSMKKVMCLCYLPGPTISNAFRTLCRTDSTGKLNDLFIYIKKKWIKNTLWTPDNWSVYGLLLRRNHDIERWPSLDCQGESKLPFYALISLLHQWAQYLETARLVSDAKLKKRRKRSKKHFDAQIYKLWKEFSKGKRTANQMLRKIARVTGGPCQ